MYHRMRPAGESSGLEKLLFPIYFYYILLLFHGTTWWLWMAIKGPPQILVFSAGSFDVHLVGKIQLLFLILFLSPSQSSL